MSHAVIPNMVLSYKTCSDTLLTNVRQIMEVYNQISVYTDIIIKVKHLQAIHFCFYPFILGDNNIKSFLEQGTSYIPNNKMGSAAQTEGCKGKFEMTSVHPNILSTLDNRKCISNTDKSV